MIAELSATFERKRRRATALIKVFRELTGRRIVAPAVELAKREVMAFHDGKLGPKKVMESDRFDRDLAPLIREMAAGRFDRPDVRLFIQKMAERKTEFFQAMREMVKADSVRMPLAGSFEEFMLAVPKQDLITLTLDALDSLYIRGALRQDAERILAAGKSLPFFWTRIRLHFAIEHTYNRASFPAKPKRGADVDLQIIWNAAPFHTFVTNDGDSAEFARVLDPKKKVLKFDELLRP